MSPSILQPFTFLDELEIRAVLNDLSGTSVAVLGDFCLDVYWTVDRSRAEESLETGLPTQPVQRALCSPGGAGNVMMNLRALGVGRIHALGLAGDDLFGRELRRLLDFPGANLEGLIIQRDNWATHAYVKPYDGEHEMNRIDHGNFNVSEEDAEGRVIEALERILGEVSVVLINHQVAGSIHDSERFRVQLGSLMKKHPETRFIVDSRGYHDAYPSGIHKLNDREVMRSCGLDADAGKSARLDELVERASELASRWGAPLVVTRGDKGCLVCEGRIVEQIFGVHIASRTDPVGAGDTFVATLAAMVSAGTNLAAAAWVANLSAAVTARKLYQTGTASPAEILQLLAEASYAHRPELADAPHLARHLDGSEIEVVSEPPAAIEIKHAIFDHDGTISTLREGWEQIMQPMMVEAVLGRPPGGAAPGLVARVEDRVRAHIEHTTGIQTIVQMHGLVDLVREFGCVPEHAIKTAPEYKEIYNRELKAMVDRRMLKLSRKELHEHDFMIKGAGPFLAQLRSAGVHLYLASGTDEEDVKHEAASLGYAEMFDGGIFGSIGHIAKDAKKIVIERILNSIGGAQHQLVAFGDGPVEMRETVRRGAYAVGVASDELRRFGCDLNKRSRLIRAGAHAIVPDFSQWEMLWRFLRLPRVD